MTYWDLKPLSRKDEFNLLMQMRKPQTKIPVILEDGFAIGSPSYRYWLSKATQTPTAVSLVENVISAVQRTQGITGRPNDPNCTHKKGTTSGSNDRQYWSCKTCDYFEEL